MASRIDEALAVRTGRLDFEDGVVAVDFDLFNKSWTSAVMSTIFKATTIAIPRLSQVYCSPLLQARKRDRTGRI